MKFKKLNSKAITPTRAYEGDAGLDFYATSKNHVKQEWYNEELGYPQSYSYEEYGTGIALEIPVGYVGLIFPRSSISTKGLMLKNAVGVIDSSYRGEITFRFQVVEQQNAAKYRVGDKIGQLIIVPYLSIELYEVDELTPTIRGIGSYGSSNK